MLRMKAIVKVSDEPSKPIVLHGVQGPIKVAGQTFGGPGAVPMPAMGGLTDEQIADVLTFVRGTFGPNAAPVKAAEVQAARSAVGARETRSSTKNPVSPREP